MIYGEEEEEEALCFVWLSGYLLAFFPAVGQEK